MRVSHTTALQDFGLVKVIDKKTLKLKGGKDETFELTGGSGSLKYSASSLDNRGRFVRLTAPPHQWPRRISRA